MGTNPYSLGPSLPAESLKPPFTPGVAGRIGFFFGPIAGAHISAISLRRMGHRDKAQKVVAITSFAAVLVAVILFFIPEGFSRIVSLATEALFYLVFPKIQNAEFEAWQAANATTLPCNGWKAIGWGLLGLVFFLMIVFAAMFALGMLGFQPR